MIGLLVLTALFLTGAIGVGLLLSLALVVRVAFWALLLPLRLMGYVLFLPFLLVKWMLQFFVGLLVLPIALLGVVLGVGGLALAGLLLVVVPLVPILIVGSVIWLIIKAATRPTMPVLRS